MSGISTDFVLDFVGNFRMVAQEQFGVFASLTEFFAFVGEPGAGFFNQSGFDAEINQFAGFGNAFAVHDVEINNLKRGSNFVFDDFDAGLTADDIVFVFNGADAANVNADGGVEFEGVTAGGGFRIAKHDADFHADLVDEDDQRVGTGDGGGQFTQCLTHQAGLQPHVRITHFAFQFGFRHQGSHRVDNQNVNGAGTDQRVGNFKSLFTGIRLGNQQIFNIYADFFGIAGVKRMFGVNKGTGAAFF